MVDRYKKNADLRAAEVPAPVVGDKATRWWLCTLLGSICLMPRSVTVNSNLVLKYGTAADTGNDLAGVVERALK